MKYPKTFLPAILAVSAALFSGPAFSANEKDDILARFDRELLIVMSGFASAREASASSAFRQEYTGSLNKFISDANTLQEVAVKLGIGEDLNLSEHARNIRSAFQAPVQSTNNASSDTKQKQKEKKQSPTQKANDPLYNFTGKSLSEQTGLGKSTGTSIQYQQTPVGFSFHMAGNAIQTLSSLGFGLRNGKYSVSSNYRNILPYLELKRDVEHFNVSCEHFDTLVEIPAWRSDFEKRLKRMARLAIQIQPVYKAYFPGKTFSISTEAERLALVYSKYLEYVKATEQAEQANSRRSHNTEAFDQVRRNNIPDKGAILREYDTAADRFAEFFADMDSIDWTSNAFSEKKQAAPKDGGGEAVKLPAKPSN